MFRLRRKERHEYQGDEWMTRRDRFHIPNYYEPNESAQGGEVEIRDDRCDGCGLCVRICPSKTLVLAPRPGGTVRRGKRSVRQVMRMKEVPECIACGDCAAICPNEACFVTKPVKMEVSLFKTLNRGPLSLPRLFNEEEDRRKIDHG